MKMSDRMLSCCQRLKSYSGKLSGMGEANLAAEVVDVVHQLEIAEGDAKKDVLYVLQERLPVSGSGNLYSPEYIHGIVDKLLEEVRDESV